MNMNMIMTMIMREINLSKERFFVFSHRQRLSSEVMQETRSLVQSSSSVWECAAPADLRMNVG